MQSTEFGEPILYKKIQIPPAFLTDAITADCYGMELVNCSPLCQICQSLSAQREWAGIIVYLGTFVAMTEKRWFYILPGTNLFTYTRLFRWTKKRLKGIRMGRGSTMLGLWTSAL